MKFPLKIHFLGMRYALEGFSIMQKKQLVLQAAYFQLIVGQLYKMGPDEILCHCVLKHKRPMIFNGVHVGVTGGHYDGKATMQNILQVGL